MDFLLGRFKATRLQYANNLYIAPCIEAGQAKLDAYYTLTERSSAYIAAIILSPHRKQQYFDITQADYPEQIKNSKSAVKELQKSQYAPVSISTKLLAQPLLNKPLVRNSFLKQEDKQEDLKLPLHFNKYQNYISAPRIKIKDIQKWWLEDTQ